jgi:hypothetical protein
MKRVILLLVLSLFIRSAFAQSKLPGFVIADAGGKYHNINTPVFKKPVLLIYFIPDCDDCRAFTAKLVKDDALFARYQVIMVTNADLNALKKFVTEFHLEDRKGLIIGTEGWTATLLRSLQVQHYPFVAEYSAKRSLMHIFKNDNELFKQTN